MTKDTSRNDLGWTSRSERIIINFTINTTTTTSFTMKFNPRIVSIPRDTLQQYHPRLVLQNMPTRAKMKETFSGASGFTLSCWILSSFLAIVIPVSKWTHERHQYYNYIGSYHEYEWKQRQYEELQNGNDIYNGSICSWWNYICRQRAAKYQYYIQNQQGNDQNNNDNRQGNMMTALPAWYIFFGGAIDAEGGGPDAEMRMNSSSNAAMKFVYSCNIITFAGLGIFGYRTLTKGRDRMGLIVALLIHAQFVLMNLITLTQGTIATDDRFFENSIYGWFGQWSVLVAYTDFWMFLHSIIFASVLGVTQLYNRNEIEEVKDITEKDAYVQPDDGVMVHSIDADYVHA